MPRTTVTGYRKSSFNDPYSVYFNGTSAKMTVPVVPDPTGWCFAMWIKPGDKGIPTHTYMSYNTAAFTNGIFVGAGTGKSSIEVTVYNNTTILSSRSITAVVGDWVHIAATYLPNGTCKIYRNGVLISSATSTGTMSVATAQTLTFNSRSYSGSYAQSSISNIVWQNTITSWTDAQVLDIYQTNKLPVGTTMYLALNEGTGTTATDTSGNGNNGTLTAPTWTTDTPTKTRTAVTFPQRRTPDNLLFNGNFEYVPPFTAATTGVNKWIDGTATGSSNADSPYKWWTPSTFTANASAQFDTSVYRSGTASLKLSTLDATGIANAAYGRNVNRQSMELSMVPALTNASYTITGWVKTNNVKTNGAGIDIIEYDGAMGLVLTSSSNRVSGTTDWTQVTKTITTSSTTRYLLVVLRNNVAGNVSDAWFDDITLTTTAPYRNRRSIDNLVENGDFESAPTFVAATTASGWIIGTAAASTTSNAYKWRLAVGAGTVSAQYDNTVYKNGTTSMKVSTGVGGYAEVVNATTKDTAIPILPSTSYTITGWMKTELISGSATSGARIIAAEYSGDFVGGAVKSTTSILTTTDWTQYSITWTTASTARYLVVGGNVRGNNGAADLSMNAWFDDITLVKN